MALDRLDREDTSRQQARLVAAYHDLGDALAGLSDVCRREMRGTLRKRPAVDMLAVRAAIRTLDHAEQAVDIAEADLRTARGEDL